VRLLSAPQGGAFAVIGHVDRNSDSTFQADKQPMIGPLAGVLRRLMNGYTVGLAMESFTRRYTPAASSLLDQRSPTKSTAESAAQANRVAEAIDIRNYIILGDPVAHIRIKTD
jgi:hypothetical protein